MSTYSMSLSSLNDSTLFCNFILALGNLPDNVFAFFCWSFKFLFVFVRRCCFVIYLPFSLLLLLPVFTHHLQGGRFKCGGFRCGVPLFIVMLVVY